MFTFLVKQSLQNRLFVAAAAAVLIIYGSLTLPRMPIDVFPDLNRPMVTVLTELPGLAPEEVDTLVSFPLETSLIGMPGVNRVRSVSSSGLSIVFVEFEWGTDIYTNRQQVAERLSLVTPGLPEGASPHMGPITSLMGEILLIAIYSEELGPMAVREIADWSIRPRLLGISGVSQVIPIGGELREYRVIPDPVKMFNNDISLNSIHEALDNYSSNAGGGIINQDDREFVIRHISRSADLENIRNLVVAYRDLTPVLLRQVAEAEFSPRPPRGDAGFMVNEAVIIAVQKQPRADSVPVTRMVEDTLDQIQATLPDGVNVSVLFRQADFIEASVKNVKHVLIEASIAVAIVLVFFLLNVRTTIISLVSIPVSILAAVIILNALGIILNTMTLGGLAIAIGEVVDDAIVDMENIFRRLRENAKSANPRPVIEVIVYASQEVRSGIIYATAIIILVFVPLFALSGIEGRMFIPLGIAYILAIFASLITAITLTPVLCYYFLPSITRLSKDESRALRLLKRLNLKAINWAFNNPKLLIGCIIVAVSSAAASVPQLPREFLPQFNEGTSVATLIQQPGVSLEASKRLGQIAERLILNVPEVVQVGRRTGRGELDEHANGIHINEIEIDLKRSDRSREAIFADIRSRLAILPVAVNVGQPISHRLDHMTSGINAQIALKIFGEDLNTLQRLAAEFEKEMSEISGITDLSIERQVNVPQIRVQIDYEKAAAQGFTSGTIISALERLTQGYKITEIIEGAKRFDLVLRLSDENRTLGGLENLLLEGPPGRAPLKNIANIIESEGPNQILRENGQKRLVVQANSDGSDITKIVAQLRDVINQTPLPLGYAVSLEGQFLSQEKAQKTIIILSLISLLLIFLVLYSRYKSVPISLMIICNIPLALIGAVAALWIAELSLSVASLVGFITLAGISARNGILKISHFINLSLYEGVPFGEALIIRGCQERLAPVLMTALSASLAMVPLLLNADQPGKEILHPLAVVIFGGLFTATLLDAILIPVLFIRFGERAIQRLRDEGQALKTLDAF